MIPRDFITEWRREAPWAQDAQIEQDLVISRALVEIFSNPFLRERLAFRGGTALYKLHIKPAARYSEDIDLVQVCQEPIGAVLDALREVLDPWLGTARWKASDGRITLIYRFESNSQASRQLKLKVEINSREHFSVLGFTPMPFAVDSRWFTGTADITTYHLNELIGTKLRALYQRRKGRDLFDLAVALKRPDIDPTVIIDVFQTYMTCEGANISRALFEKNLLTKMKNPSFGNDIRPLLTVGTEWSPDVGAEIIMNNLIACLPGEPWKQPEDR